MKMTIKKLTIALIADLMALTGLVGGHLYNVNNPAVQDFVEPTFYVTADVSDIVAEANLTLDTDDKVLELSDPSEEVADLSDVLGTAEVHEVNQTEDTEVANDTDDSEVKTASIPVTVTIPETATNTIVAPALTETIEIVNNENASPIAEDSTVRHEDGGDSFNIDDIFSYFSDDYGDTVVKTVLDADRHYSAEYRIDENTIWNVSYDGDMDHSLKASLGMVPEIVLDKLFDDGFKFMIDDRAGFDADGNDENTVGYFLGIREMTDYVDADEVKSGELYIDAYTYLDGKIALINDAHEIAYATCHEVGHALAEYVRYGENCADETDEWKDIYNSEKDNCCVNDYGRSNWAEYFAESFQWYCIDGSKLRDSAPRTYAYIDDTVNSLYSTEYVVCKWCNYIWLRDNGIQAYDRYGVPEDIVEKYEKMFPADAEEDTMVAPTVAENISEEVVEETVDNTEEITEDEVVDDTEVVVETEEIVDYAETVQTDEVVEDTELTTDTSEGYIITNVEDMMNLMNEAA